MIYLESYSKKGRANFQMPQDHADKKNVLIEIWNKALSERTLGRSCITHMSGFFLSGTCECRNIVNC